MRPTESTVCCASIRFQPQVEPFCEYARQSCPDHPYPHISASPTSTALPSHATATRILAAVPDHVRWRPLRAEPITIGSTVWLGGGVIVCPGVSIGDNTVVGAGAVVTKDLPAIIVALGSPARVTRTIPEADPAS